MQRHNGLARQGRLDRHQQPYTDDHHRHDLDPSQHRQAASRKRQYPSGAEDDGHPVQTTPSAWPKQAPSPGAGQVSNLGGPSLVMRPLQGILAKAKAPSGMTSGIRTPTHIRTDAKIHQEISTARAADLAAGHPKSAGALTPLGAATGCRLDQVATHSSQQPPTDTQTGLVGMTEGMTAKGSCSAMAESRGMTRTATLSLTGGAGKLTGLRVPAEGAAMRAVQPRHLQSMGGWRSEQMLVTGNLEVIMQLVCRTPGQSGHWLLCKLA